MKVLPTHDYRDVGVADTTTFELVVDGLGVIGQAFRGIGSRLPR